jgi:hypothetical protein
MRRKTLSMMMRPREAVLAAKSQLGEVTATPSLMRLSTALSPSGRRGRELRQFRPRRPGVHAPILPQVMPQFAQQQRQEEEEETRIARMLLSLSLPLYAQHPSFRMSKIIVAHCGRHLHLYTPQRRVGLTQKLRKLFSLCISSFMSLLITIFVSCVFMLRTGSPAYLVYQYP